MTRRALLVGAQTYGLNGPEDDVAAMKAGLARHGFTDVRPCVGSAATRDGIVGAYEQLIADTEAGDTVLFYYSGHGSYVVPAPGEVAAVAANNRQFIVPTDFVEPVGGDFRGITGVELSVLLERLTARTRNAVVVLDCCHSALMSRTLGSQVPRQLPRATMLDLMLHLRRRLGQGVPVDLTDPLGNPYAVRLVACATREVAYEQPRWDGGGGWYGLFTDAFLRALDESVAAPVSWSRLVDRIRRLVLPEQPHQRPEIEGPAERLLFTEEPDDSAGALPAVQRGARVRLPGAALLGVQEGDRFSIMAGGAAGPGADGCVATVEVDHCDPEAAGGVLVFAGSAAALPAGARAFRTRAVAPRVAVLVPAMLRDAVGGCTFARPAEAGEQPPFRVVEAPDGGWVLADRFGPLHYAGAEPGDLRGLVLAVEAAARATVLREVRAESGWTADLPVDVEWGLVRSGERHPLPLSGAEVRPGDPIYLEVRNRGGEDLYVSLLDVGVSYGITHITRRAGSGDRFEPGASYLFGRDRATHRLTGRRLSWPTGLDPVASRPETVLAFITTGPYDLTSLVQPPLRGTRRAAEPGGLLSHFLHGTARDVGEEPAGFCVRSVEFTLSPGARESP